MASSSAAEPPSNAIAGTGHLPALDGVRGIAILMVLFYHFMVFGARLQGHASSLWIDRVVYRVASFGQDGVDLFFVLSGFLITRILLNARGKGNYFTSFYARRALRIFPAYYGMLILLIVILPILPSLRDDAGLEAVRDHQMVYWTYLYNIAVSIATEPAIYLGPYDQPHFWSLAVEEQFYLVWPAVVFFVGGWRLGIFCLLCMIAAPYFRHELYYGEIPWVKSSLGLQWLMPSRMDQLAIGGLIAVATAWPAILRWASRLAVPVGIAALVIMFAYVIREDPRGRFGGFTEPIAMYGYTISAVTFAAFLTTVIGGPAGFLQASLSNRVLTFFGRYSYGLYVIHYQIMNWLIQFFGDHDLVPQVICDNYTGNTSVPCGALPLIAGSNIPAAFGFFLLGTGISLAVAWLSWHLYERQFLKLKRFVPYGRSSSRAASASNA